MEPEVVARREAVLFDFGGTLDAPGVTWKERAWRLYREAGLVAEATVFDPIFYKADDALVGTVPAGLSFTDTVRRVFEGVSAGLRVADARLTERLAQRFVADARRHLAAGLPVLQRLAHWYSLGVVSNFYGNLEEVCTELRVAGVMRVIADSAVVGTSKPDARIFRHALDALGVEPRDAWFVGDSRPRDMDGARALGMRHVWVVEPGAPPAAPCCPADPVIRSLDELEPLLAR